MAPSGQRTAPGAYFAGWLANPTMHSSVRARSNSGSTRYRCLPAASARKLVRPASSAVIRPGADISKYPPPGRTA